ncbi:sodium-independent sulfate anion transporter-like [Coccinella septempunctata]|uniref:sodium-independent sulfate anion transporter-like n=1 Tax=Coccinella septempunctata TaxID=41139 RepID=UPI001D075106|nr:sodium-independent sulfate anion transporter-like [Coccinella septempunctata]
MRKFSTSSGQLRHVKRSYLQRIHITQWLPQYKKFDFISDLVAGLTVGMMLIPQSIAYAGIASLPAQYGLYTAFVGSFTYVIFGTIKQVSIGPTSLLSMLSFTYLEGYPVDYVIFLTFLAGCVELAMGLLNLGFLVDFISPPVSAGFTAAISFLIMASQLKSLLGLKIVAHDFVELMTLILRNIGNIKWSDTVLGFSSILFLFLLKKLSCLPSKNRTLQKTLWFVSISRNALIVVITSVIAYYYCDRDGKAPFALSSKVPSGLPQFSLPKLSAVHNNQTSDFFDMIHTLGSGIFVVPICAILSNIAIAKSFASGVIVDASQEMITLGICNIFGSCVQAMPSSGAFSRSAVANASGVRTPMQGFYSGTVIILALSFLTPYFYYIPKATLAAVLISAVSSMIEYSLLPVLWRTNRIDFCFCLITCCLGVIYGADIGLIVGAVLNLVVLLKDWSRPNIIIKLCSWEKTDNTYVLIKPEFGLCYPARDYLTEKVIEAQAQHEHIPMVLDLSNVLKIDYAAAEALKNLLETYNQDKVKLVLVNLNDRVRETLKKLNRSDKIKYCHSSSTVYDEMFELIEDPGNKIPLLECCGEV